MCFFNRGGIQPWQSLDKGVRPNPSFLALEIKPCRLGSRIRDMEAEWSLKVINDLISWNFGKQNWRCELKIYLKFEPDGHQYWFTLYKVATRRETLFIAPKVMFKPMKIALPFYYIPTYKHLLLWGVQNDFVLEQIASFCFPVTKEVCFSYYLFLLGL